MALEVIALGVSTAALLISIGAILWQGRQGQRIGMSVISTVDQIYRRLGAGGEDNESLDVYWFPEVSTKYVRPGRSVKLSVAGGPTGRILGIPWEIRCVLEDAAGRRSQIVKTVESTEVKTASSIECEAVFPDEFKEASTEQPGRYHIWWRGREAIDVNGRREPWYLLAEDAFGVLP